jgi:TRAP-type mannitol/chloroaromatic compound transport system substrate-binding protein
LNEHGVQLRKLPDDVIDALRMANNELMQEVAAESEFSKRVYDSYTTFQKNVKAWHELSEKAYINARD